jgi:hypothetical protein
MTPIVNIDTLTIQNLPPNKRLPVWMGMINAFVSPLKWLMGIFTQYKEGGVSTYWDVAVSYGIGDRIVYNYAVYESLVGSNLGNIPDVDLDSWLLVNASFLGANERRLYQGKKLILEYALNRYFAEELDANGEVGFRQPDSAFTPTPSSIYVQDDIPDLLTFTMYPDEFQSDAMFPTYSTKYMTPTPIYAGASPYQFIVWIPTAVFTSINSDVMVADQIVTNFVNRYAVAGTFFTVQTY